MAGLETTWREVARSASGASAETRQMGALKELGLEHKAFGALS